MNTVIIGRSSRCDVILNDNNICCGLAEMWITNGLSVNSDKSTNGSLVNGQMIYNNSTAVARGSYILLAGKVSLTWNEIYAPLPFSNYRIKKTKTAYQERYRTEMQQQSYNQKNQTTNEKLNFGLVLLAFLIPLAGWIICFAWKDETPNRAYMAGIIGTISFVLGIISIV